MRKSLWKSGLMHEGILGGSVLCMKILLKIEQGHCIRALQKGGNA